MKYKVVLSRETEELAEVEVEADNADEAETKALIGSDSHDWWTVETMRPLVDSVEEVK